MKTALTEMVGAAFSLQELFQFDVITNPLPRRIPVTGTTNQELASCTLRIERDIHLEDAIDQLSFVYIFLTKFLYTIRSFKGSQHISGNLRARFQNGFSSLGMPLMDKNYGLSIRIPRVISAVEQCMVLIIYWRYRRCIREHEQRLPEVVDIEKYIFDVFVTGMD